MISTIKRETLIPRIICLIPRITTIPRITHLIPRIIRLIPRVTTTPKITCSIPRISHLILRIFKPIRRISTSLNKISSTIPQITTNFLRTTSTKVLSMNPLSSMPTWQPETDLSSHHLLHTTSVPIQMPLQYPL